MKPEPIPSNCSDPTYGFDPIVSGPPCYVNEKLWRLCSLAVYHSDALPRRSVKRAAVKAWKTAPRLKKLLIMGDFDAGTADKLTNDRVARDDARIGGLLFAQARD